MVVADRNALSMFGWLTPSDTTKSQIVGSAKGAASDVLLEPVPISITKDRGPWRLKVINVRPCSLRDVDLRFVISADRCTVGFLI